MTGHPQPWCPEAVTRLVDYYRHAALNMRGLPVCNPALQVEGVGFREHLGRQVGVIVTPWFMNLTVLPASADVITWRSGAPARLAFPSGLYDFVVSAAGDNGLIATCSLFSLMRDFTDHEAAQKTALAAVEALFEPEPPAAPADPGPPRVFSRRSLFGG